MYLLHFDDFFLQFYVPKNKKNALNFVYIPLTRNEKVSFFVVNSVI